MLRDNTIVEVPLTQGFVALIDAEDAADILRFRWCTLRTRNTFYAMRRRSKTESPRRETEYLHRRIMQAPDGFEVDHKNGNGLDCRRSNMRLATHRQNLVNTGSRPANTSGYKGVSWDKGNQKWRASISAHGRSYNLGRFATKEEAAHAYDEAASRLHGSFARLNFNGR